MVRMGPGAAARVARLRTHVRTQRPHATRAREWAPTSREPLAQILALLMDVRVAVGQGVVIVRDLGVGRSELVHEELDLVLARVPTCT